jgi:hypothetical protein
MERKPIMDNQGREVEQQRPLTKEEKQRLEKAQEAIAAICQEFGIELVPRLVLEPAGVVFAQVGARLIPQKSNIIIPQFKGPKQPGGSQ